MRANTVLVFFYCGNKVRPVARTVPSGADPLQFSYDELLAGPNPAERKMGFGIATKPGWRIDARRKGPVVTIDFDRRTLDLEYFLATTFGGTDAYDRTGLAFPNVSKVRITVGGKSMCDVSSECDS